MTRADHRVARRIADALALAVIALALSVLIGWAVASRTLAASGGHAATMKATTAWCLILLSLAVLALNRDSDDRRLRAMRSICAGVALLIALTTFLQGMTNLAADLTALVTPNEDLVLGHDARLQMTPQTAIALSLASLSILGRDLRSPWNTIGHWMMGLAMIWPVVALFQHLSGIGTVFTVPELSRMAAGTAAALIALAVATALATPDRPPVATILAAGPGGISLRRTLPVVILTPFVGGVLSLQGNRLGLYGPGVAILIITALTGLSGTIIVWLTARRLSAGDQLRRQAERRLQRSENRLRALLEHAPAGIYETDATGTRVYANERWLAISGLAPDAVDELDWYAAVHPDDRERLAASWTRAVATHSDLRERFRYRKSDGAVTWVDALAAPIAPADADADADAKTQQSGWIGSEIDISTQVRHERELRARERIATAMIRSLDGEAALTLACEQTARLLGCDEVSSVRCETDRQGLVIAHWSARDSPHHGPGRRIPTTSECVIANVLNDPRPGARSHRCPADAHCAAHDHVPPMGAAAPIWFEDTLWGALAAVDRRKAPFAITELAQLQRFADLLAFALIAADAHRRLRELASTDQLTGLPNRRAFNDYLAAQVAQARRHGRPLSLAMLDIDHFKRVNDTHGHPGGDRVLRTLSDRLRTHARAGEMLARIGGEEFALVIPDADAEAALTAGERLHRLVRDEPIAPAGTVTISVGLATLTGEESDDDLLRRADRALYAAKQAGRDRVVTDGSLNRTP